MDNADKMQEVSSKENPENVQSESESPENTDLQSFESSKEPTEDDTTTNLSEDEGHGSHESKPDTSENLESSLSGQTIDVAGPEATEKGESIEATSEEVTATPDATTVKEEESLAEIAGADAEVEVDQPSDPDTSHNQKEEGEPKPAQAAPGIEDDHEKQGEAHSDDGGEHENHEEEESLDLSEASKPELITALNEVKNEENVKAIDRVLREVKPRFDELYEIAKNEALQAFVSDGNEADAFVYNGDGEDKSFFALYNLLKTKRNKIYKDLENVKEQNLQRKEQILDQLREIIDGEESENSFNKVRELQSEWKKVGPVPGAQNKTLWANYNALLDRFYDNRSIYFELKDLDRKKNLESKQELCEKAEALAQAEDIKEAIIQLNELHEDYKHIGPVPKEEQEALWQRFKAASDTVYSRRKVYFDELKKQLEDNLEIKLKLIDEVKQFLTFDSDRITEWNNKTKEILEVQKKWEAIGGVPREKAKEINKEFWNSFKGFFANKNQFFKTLESQREENLEKKEEIIKQAEELKESEDFVSTADKLKHLQSQWKEIGPVPEKARNETYAKFKAACDHFFERRRSQNKERNKEYDENLKLKQEVIDQINDATNVDEIDLDLVYDLIDQYAGIGFVPKNAIKKIQRRFDEAISKVLENGSLNEYDIGDLKGHIQRSRMRNSPGGEGKIRRKENSLKRKISTIENDINTYRTNMEFFAKSKTADKMKAEFDEKIEMAKQELKELRSQLRALSQ